MDLVTRNWPNRGLLATLLGRLKKLLLRLSLLVLLFTSPYPTYSSDAGIQIADAPPLLLANVYDDVDLSEYWVSEKLDGVRAYWDGTRLVSRRGNVLNAPAWFSAGFPEVSLDGELWMGRNTFEALSAAVRRHNPDVEEWRKIRYMVFDLPAESESFNHRLAKLRSIVGECASPYLALVGQVRVGSRVELQQRLRMVVSAGGEGLMLHKGSSLYRSGRSDDLLKLKHYQDAEARVIGYIPGKGKFEGMLGSLLVELPDGRRFRIGTGFSDAERREPPRLGSLVTYRYHGLTSNGLPRFASFMRVRIEH